MSNNKRPYISIPPDVKAWAIDMVINEVWKIAAAATSLKINANALAKGVAKHRKGPHHERRPRVRSPRLFDHQREQICDWAGADCAITLRQLADCAFEELGFCVSVVVVVRALRSFNYSFKAIKHVPERRNCGRTIELRRAYALEYMRHLAMRTNFVFVDEVGFSCSL